jgi:hypothetical protein
VDKIAPKCREIRRFVEFLSPTGSRLYRWQATRLKAEAGVIDEVTWYCHTAGSTLLHVLFERLHAVRLAAFAGSDFDGNLDRYCDVVFGPYVSIWNHASPICYLRRR